MMQKKYKLTTMTTCHHLIDKFDYKKFCFDKSDIITNIDDFKNIYYYDLIDVMFDDSNNYYYFDTLEEINNFIQQLEQTNIDVVFENISRHFNNIFDNKVETFSDLEEFDENEEEYIQNDELTFKFFGKGNQINYFLNKELASDILTNLIDTSKNVIEIMNFAINNNFFRRSATNFKLYIEDDIITFYDVEEVINILVSKEVLETLEKMQNKTDLLQKIQNILEVTYLY